MKSLTAKKKGQIAGALFVLFVLLNLVNEIPLFLQYNGSVTVIHFVSSYWPELITWVLLTALGISLLADDVGFAKITRIMALAYCAFKCVVALRFVLQAPFQPLRPILEAAVEALLLAAFITLGKKGEKLCLGALGLYLLSSLVEIIHKIKSFVFYPAPVLYRAVSVVAVLVFCAALVATALYVADKPPRMRKTAADADADCPEVFGESEDPADKDLLKQDEAIGR